MIGNIRPRRKDRPSGPARGRTRPDARE